MRTLECYCTRTALPQTHKKKTILFTEAIMKIISAIIPILLSTLATGFVPVSLPAIRTSTKSRFQTVLKTYESTVTEEVLNHKLEGIAKKLRLQVYDVSTGVYGFESTDPLCGIENIRAKIPFDPSMGLELTEVAHSSQSYNEDSRGLVLLSKVSGNAAASSNIQVGDTIVGIFCEDAGFKESVTALDYDSTIDAITRAKTHAHMMDEEAAWDGGSTITLEVNRLVPRSKVHVIVEGAGDKPIEIEALAGDNLRSLLMHHQIDLYDKGLHRLDQPSVKGSNCGGEGICSTCMVKILEGAESLKRIGPKEKEIKTGRPAEWRAACQTILGAENQESTVRVKIHPEWATD